MAIGITNVSGSGGMSETLNITVDQVLSGVKFTNDGKTFLTGTMPNRGAVTITPSGSNQTIAAGYHNGSGRVNAVSVPVANVLTGTTIAGQAGTMPNHGNVTIDPSPDGDVIRPRGFYNSVRVKKMGSNGHVLKGWIQSTGSYLEIDLWDWYGQSLNDFMKIYIDIYENGSLAKFGTIDADRSPWISVIGSMEGYGVLVATHRELVGSRVSFIEESGDKLHLWTNGSFKTNSIIELTIIRGTASVGYEVSFS